MARKRKADASGTVKLTPVAPDTPDPAPAPKIVQGAQAIVPKAMIKKPEFLERALARTDMRKRDAKPAMEAALAEIADLLAEGHELNLPPMGKLKLVKSKDVGEGAQVLTLKLRTMKDSAGQAKIPGIDPAPDVT